MKILFDQNVPRKLRSLLPQHNVQTAGEMGWGEVSNGALLQAAEEAGFEVLVTADQNIAYQQNLAGRKLALIVLSSNDWHAIKLHAAGVVAALDKAIPGLCLMVEVPKPQG
jgi:predicted nuclease of predicted toxin-antitoxin system